MSVSFSTPTQFNFLSRHIMDEFVVDYNEIDLVFGGYYPFPAEYLERGHIVQDAWAQIQTVSPESFINHVSGPLNADATNWRNFTMGEFSTAAGLAGGPRRAREWNGINEPTWLSGGNPSRGDIIGPWLAEDFQKIYSTFMWTSRTSTMDVSAALEISDPSGYMDWLNQGITSYEAYAVDRSLGFSRSMGVWVDPVWGSDAANPFLYDVSVRYNFGWSDSTSYGEIPRSRRRGNPRITGLPALSHSADIYLVLEPVSGVLFDNLDSFAMIENKMTLYESIGEGSATEHQATSYIGDDITDPAVLVGLYDNMNEQELGPTTYLGGLNPPDFVASGCRINRSKWLLKWSFSYRNE